jgi:hypothetical protein
MKVREMLGQIQRVPSGKQRQPERQAETQSSSDARSIHEPKRNSTQSGGRVMAVVSALEAKDTTRKDHDSKQIESEFEKLLVSVTYELRFKERKLTDTGRTEHSHEHAGQDEILRYQHQGRLYPEESSRKFGSQFRNFQHF